MLYFQPSSGTTSTDMFSGGFLNKGKHGCNLHDLKVPIPGSGDGGFPFLASQENPATEPFFCDAGRTSTLPESNTGN